MHLPDAETGARGSSSFSKKKKAIPLSILNLKSIDPPAKARTRANSVYVKLAGILHLIEKSKLQTLETNATNARVTVMIQHQRNMQTAAGKKSSEKILHHDGLNNKAPSNFLLCCSSENLEALGTLSPATPFLATSWCLEAVKRHIELRQLLPPRPNGSFQAEGKSSTACGSVRESP